MLRPGQNSARRPPRRGSKTAPSKQANQRARQPGLEHRESAVEEKRRLTEPPPVAEWGKVLRTARDLLDNGDTPEAQDAVDSAFHLFVEHVGLAVDAGAVDDMPYIRDAEVWLRDVFTPQFGSSPLPMTSLAAIYSVRGACLREAGVYGRAALEFGMAAELVAAAIGNQVENVRQPFVQRRPQMRRRLGPHLGRAVALREAADEEAARQRQEEVVAHQGTLAHAGLPESQEELEDLERACEEKYTAQLRCLCVGAVPGSATGVDTPARVALDRGGWRDRRLADSARPVAFRRGTVTCNPTEGCAINALPSFLTDPVEQHLPPPDSPRLTDPPPVFEAVPLRQTVLRPGQAVLECGRRLRTGRRHSAWNFVDAPTLFADLAVGERYEGISFHQRPPKTHSGWCGETPTRGAE